MRWSMRTMGIVVIMGGALAWAAQSPLRLPAALENLQAYSVQMHLHGSMSEGSGSMRGANVWAKRVGVDVLWWTDHDWRVSYHSYVSGFGFEVDGLVSEGEVPYTARGKAQLDQAAATTSRSLESYYRTQYALTPSRSNGSFLMQQAAISTEQAVEGSRSLKLQATARSNSGFSDFFYTFDVGRRRAKRSLASNVRLHFALLPVEPFTNHLLTGLDVLLSQQPPDMKQGRIRYVVTGLSERELEAMNTESVRYVKLQARPGVWNTFDVNVTRDAERFGLGGIDNALSAVSFGMALREGTATVYFDDYRIGHDYQGPRLLARARDMAAALTEEFGTVNYVGQEMSYQAHLNALGDAVPMIDYDQYPLGLDPAATADFIRAYGGASSLNHIFGTSRPRANRNVMDPVAVRKWENDKIEELAANDVYGADMLEVGYPIRILPIESFLRVWDNLSLRQVYVTGNGTSDTHSNGHTGWMSGNNYVTWVWAQSKSQADVIDALKRGRCFFGDPAQFQGILSVATAEGYTMGQVVVTDALTHDVNIDIVGLMDGARVEAVIDGLVAAEWTATGTLLHRTITVTTTAPTFIRVNVYRPDGRPLLFSNPIYFTRTVPERGISDLRRIDHQE